MKKELLFYPFIGVSLVGIFFGIIFLVSAKQTQSSASSSFSSSVVQNSKTAVIPVFNNNPVVFEKVATKVQVNAQTEENLISSSSQSSLPSNMALSSSSAGNFTNTPTISDQISKQISTSNKAYSSTTVSSAPIQNTIPKQPASIISKPKPETKPEPEIEILKPVPVVSTQNNPKSTISIPKINLQATKYNYSSLFNINDLYQKMIYSPIMENQSGSEPCQTNKHTYLYGHSEPSNPKEVGPATSIFANVHTLSNDDLITITDSSGKECKYKVYSKETIQTDQVDKISLDEYQQLFFPDVSGGSILTLQTCKLGSSTIRIIIRAKII